MAVPFTPTKQNTGAVPFNPGSAPAAPAAPSVSSAASSMQPPKRNIGQKALGIVFDPISNVVNDALKPISRGIVSGVEAFQSPQQKTKTEARYQATISDPNKVFPGGVPIVGTQVKPLKDVTLRTTTGDVAQTAALATGSPAAAGALYVGGGALSEGKSTGTAIGEAALGAIAGKLLEMGISKASPYLGAALSKYGKPLYDKLAEIVPKESQAALKAAADAIDKRIAKATPKGISKISDAAEAFGKKATDLVEKGVAKTGLKAKTLEERAVDALRSTADTMTKAERRAAIKAGNIKSTGLGGKEFPASDEVKRAASILKEKWNEIVSGGPVKGVGIVKDKISELGAKAEKYLTRYGKDIPVEGKGGALEKMTQMVKNETKTMTQAQKKAFMEQVQLFLKQLPEGEKFSSVDFYRAIKKWENDIASTLPKGKDAILDPTGVANGQVRAVSTIRQYARELLGSKNKLFSSKMYDLSTLYETLDNLVEKAEQQSGNAISRALDSKMAKRAATAAGIAGIGYGGFEAAKKIIGQ